MLEKKILIKDNYRIIFRLSLEVGFPKFFLVDLRDPGVYGVFCPFVSGVSSAVSSVHNDSAISSLSSESKAAQGRSNLGSVNCTGLDGAFS